MKKNNTWNHKHIFSACIGAAALLLLGFSACDFQPAKAIARDRPVGGGLAQGRVLPNEFLESGGGGSGGATIATIQSGDKKNYPMLSKEAIKDLLDKTDAKHLPQNVMAEEPSFTPPYKVGKVKKEALELSVERLNALRRISGLYPVEMSDTDNDNAQYGAFLMKLTNQFKHGGIPKPDGMSEDDWKKGNNATATSNIYPINNLIGAIDGYNRDPGNPDVGHRLHQMSPGLKTVGIGFVPGSHCEKVIGNSGPQQDPMPADFDWNFVSYPAAGYFPLEGNLFGSPAFWHVQFNGSKYTVGSGKIIVTQVATGEQWVEEHGGGGTIIFNKSNTWRPELGTYTFEVTGVRGKDTGIPERFVFTTEFFNRHTP